MQRRDRIQSLKNALEEKRKEKEDMLQRQEEASRGRQDSAERRALIARRQHEMEVNESARAALQKYADCDPEVVAELGRWLPSPSVGSLSAALCVACSEGSLIQLRRRAESQGRC